ncbi:D-glycerate dehydrogenase [Pseudenhygromyxa sp. WMMC2535]|uniref:2-hydroxyacid dehydrogenase n=1 Tax=Pseudenhygromyxa sp. WMMC2535 TaxID=2712867 RepID=UPI001555D477|nr:D-glycerate dehydrogenase [Pseudenhygromyxa sp. WMMC2535]NVB43382.1 D-glycerate dehydrogenase [Pseudenhygromyxa sp. WMMC2535]
MSAPAPAPAPALIVVPPDLPRDWLDPVFDHPGLEVIVGLDALPEARQPELVGLMCLLSTPIDEALLSRFPALRVVANVAVGYDNVDTAACLRHGVRVGNTPGVLTDATADLAMTLLLAAARGLVEAREDALAGRWQKWKPDRWLGVELRGAKLGVVGLGQIGYAVARRASAFGMDILYHSRSPKPEAERSLGARRCTLDELLAASDFVSLHVPLSPETHRLIDAAALARMKPTATLINTARGAVLDQDALIAALHAGRLRAAALDVTEPEPLPPEHPLFSAPRCLVLPHVGSATATTRRRMTELACANLIAGVEGRALPAAIDLGAG